MSKKYEPIIYRDGERYFYRFSANQRVQHVVLFVTIILLALTGFPVRHAEEAWAKPLYDFMGGPEIAPLIHRGAGTVLLLLFVFHTGYWLYIYFKKNLGKLKKENRLNVKNATKELLSLEMVPNKKDWIDIKQIWKYLLYITNRP
ncbi:MAG: hypothetical protein PVG22_11655, partial [Chromatiales bacterium]